MQYLYADKNDLANGVQQQTRPSGGNRTEAGGMLKCSN